MDKDSIVSKVRRYPTTTIWLAVIVILEVVTLLLNLAEHH